MQREIAFGRHRFDPPTGRLWSGKREIKLTPKAAAVLAVLLARAGEPVTRDELFASVWGDTVVSDAALASCIQELREALGDDAKQSRFIETRHRRGYRFVAPLSPPADPGPDSRPAARVLPQPPPVVVGRERELGELRASLDRATRGQRQVVFVTGEPGIGKTTLVEAFLADAAASHPGLRIGQGRCIDHYGAGEPFLPVLEALTRLCREPGGADLVRVLRQHAPSWLVQMPSLLHGTEMKTLQRQTSGVSRERMLRELAEAVEVVTAERPLVLWLEDLHWSDVSTLDWLAYVGRRPESARLLLLGVYRSGEVLARGHPLATVKDELEVQGRCRELPLSLLSPAAVEEYLARRFPSAAPHAAGLAGLARLIYQRTEGNSLFVVNVVADLVTRGILSSRDGLWHVAQAPDVIQVAIPDDVRGMIARQLDRLRPDERRILEAASAAGAEFSAAAVAAGAGVALDEADGCCAALVRHESFLAARGLDEWPDGTVASRYGFRHALYQDVVYEQVSAGHRVELHLRIGARIESAFGDRTGEAAPELAMHFQRGRDVDRAIRHLLRAGEIASRRSAHREAVGHLTRALELVGSLPDSPERTKQEVATQIALGPALMAIEGWGAPAVERTYARARELCERAGDSPQLFQVLWGLWQFRASRAELGEARALGERLLALAQRTGDPRAVLQAHHALWTSLFSLGELVAARGHVVQGLALYDPEQHAAMAPIYGHDAGVCGFSIGAWTLELLGESDQATRHAEDAMALARGIDHPFSEAHALVLGAFLHRVRGDWRTTRRLAESAIGVAQARGFALLLARATVMRGWAMAQGGEIEDGITQMREGIAAVRRFGSNFLPGLLGCLADGHARAGRLDAALDAVTEALGTERRIGSQLFAAELHQLEGELRLQTHDTAAAERCLRTALEVARRQQALTLERRARTSLRELLDRQGRADEARRLSDS